MARLADIVSTSLDVAAARSRKQQTERLATLLGSLAAAEVRPAVAFLCGELRQAKLGLGYATLRKLRALPKAGGDGVTLLELDEIFQRLGELSGKGSGGRRAQLLEELFGRLDEAERDFVGRLVLGELRQGALEAVVIDALG